MCVSLACRCAFLAVVFISPPFFSDGSVFAADPAVDAARDLAMEALATQSYAISRKVPEKLKAAEKKLAEAADPESSEAQLVKSTIRLVRDGRALYRTWIEERNKVRSAYNKWNDKDVAQLQAALKTIDELEDIGLRYGYKEAAFAVERTAFEIAVKLRTGEEHGLRAFDQPVAELLKTGPCREGELEAVANHQHDVREFLSRVKIASTSSSLGRAMYDRIGETRKAANLRVRWGRQASSNRKKISDELMPEVEKIKGSSTWFPLFEETQKAWIKTYEDQMRAEGYIKRSEMPAAAHVRLGSDPWAEPSRFRYAFPFLVKAGELEKALAMNKALLASGADRGAVDGYVIGACMKHCESPSSPHREACADHLRELYHITPPGDLKVAAFKPVMLFTGIGLAGLASVLFLLGLVKRMANKRSTGPLPEGWSA